MNTKIHHVVISRSLTQYEVMTNATDKSAQDDLVREARESLAEFNRLLDTGWKIIDSFDGQHGNVSHRAYVLRYTGEKIAQDTLIRELHDPEIKSTYSKTHEQQFDYIAVRHGQHDRVNIFDHPDPERNTFKICVARGWNWQSLQYAIMHLGHVFVTVAHDGDWWSLVDIVSFDEYLLVIGDEKLANHPHFIVEKDSDNESK